MLQSEMEGVSYLVQNAIDYFDNASTENLTQRMLNLYYGTLALMEAEMLVYGSTYKSWEKLRRLPGMVMEWRHSEIRIPG